MARDRNEQDELDNDPPDRLEEYAIPERRQFDDEQISIDFTEDENKKAFEEMDAELGRITSIKVESLFDVAPDPEPIGRERILIRRWEK